MRPTLFILTCSPSQNELAANPGLSLTGDLVYNDRQKLPLTGRVPLSSVGTSFTSEADMKPARPKQSTSSSSGTSLSQAAGTETRAQRLARIRREIEEGTYETEEKLERAIERMLGVLHAD